MSSRGSHARSARQIHSNARAARRDCGPGAGKTVMGMAALCTDLTGQRIVVVLTCSQLERIALAREQRDLVHAQRRVAARGIASLRRQSVNWHTLAVD